MPAYHRRHISPVLVRGWSRPMDGIEATIWASQNAFDRENTRRTHERATPAAPTLPR